jgi:hypothetical protein
MKTIGMGVIRAAVVALLFAGSGGATAQVANIFVDKTRVYDQTSATAVALKPPRSPCNFNCPLAFSARVNGSNLAGIQPPTLSGPISSAALGSFWNAGTLGFNGNNEWELGMPIGGEWDSPTQADLDSIFGSGTYTLTVQGQAYSVSLTGDTYPTPPVMTISGSGNWSGGQYVFDPRAPLTIATSTPVLGPRGGSANVYGCRPAMNVCGFGAGGSSGSPASVSIPANTFVDGETIFFTATFASIADQFFGPGGTPTWFAAYNARTQAFLKASIQASSPAQVQSVALGKGFGYIQTGPSTAIVDPRTFNYAFIPTVDGVGLSGMTAPFITGPYNPALSQSNGGVFVYNAADSGWRYGTSGQGWATATLADLNAAFANGTYTITVNGNAIPLTLTGDAYPNAPIMSFSGNGAWANGQYVVDPAQAITITTNAFTGYGTHVDDGICILALVPGYTLPFTYVGPFGCGWAQARQFASQAPGVKTLSYTIPANTLVSGQSYGVQTFFSSVVDTHPVAGLPGSTNAAFYYVRTKATIKAQTPLFPLTVTSNITPTVANATATFQPRPQDVGTTQSVYVFAVAPSTVVTNAAAAEKIGGPRWRAKGEKAGAQVQCLLAQLNSSGQLTAVSTSGLAAYITGALSAQGQSVNLLANVPTPNIAGATFYLGYGTTSQQMIASGVNQRALSVAASGVSCDPQAPQTGWWWNTVEGGRGYSIEVAGDHIFYASYLYDVSGRSTWLVATGNTSVDGSLFSGDLFSFAGGQTLGGAFPGFPPSHVEGQITLAFSDATHGTIAWPGGTIPIERFDIVPGGVAMSPQANQPEGGWWWNAQEPGRGFFLEWQGGQLYMAGYMYDDNGNPVWYLSTNTTPSTNLQSYSGTWWQYGNGQTLTGAYKPAARVSDNVAPVTIQFSGPATGLMTLPGGRTTDIRRFRF